MQLDPNNLNVFIAEDEPLVLLGFQEIVTECGHTVVGTAMDGESTVRGVATTNPDIIILDLNMPVMDGLTALEKIQKQRKIPTIVITGDKSNDALERACDGGVYAYLTKPVNEHEIRSALRVVAVKAAELKKVEYERDKAKTELEERKLIERAKGILMENFGLSEPQAMKALQRKSNNASIRLVQAALEVIKVGK